jgi:hypothetical protein
MGDELRGREDAALGDGGVSQVSCPTMLLTRHVTSCRWATQRKAFGKPLTSQAVIRARLGAMIQRCEAVQNWLENVTHQMCNMVGRPSSVSRLACADLRIPLMLPRLVVRGAGEPPRRVRPPTHWQ